MLVKTQNSHTQYADCKQLALHFIDRTFKNLIDLCYISEFYNVKAFDEFPIRVNTESSSVDVSWLEANMATARR